MAHKFCIMPLCWPKQARYYLLCEIEINQKIEDIRLFYIPNEQEERK